VPPSPGRQIGELEDAVVVPHLVGADHHEVPQVRQLGEQLLEHLEVLRLAGDLRRDGQGRLGVPQLVLELVIADRGVHRDQHGVEPGGRQQGDDPLSRVREIHRQPIAGTDAQIPQGGREGRRLRVHLGVRQPTAPGDQALPCPVPVNRVCEPLSQMVGRQEPPPLNTGKRLSYTHL
jgi:hypothetical protein